MKLVMANEAARRVQVIDLEGKSTITIVARDTMSVGDTVMAVGVMAMQTGKIVEVVSVKDSRKRVSTDSTMEKVIARIPEESENDKMVVVVMASAGGKAKSADKYARMVAQKHPRFSITNDFISVSAK